jgi:hypothetical protein
MHSTDLLGHEPTGSGTIDLESPAFAVRLGLLLTACRERSGVRRGVLASASHGTFTSRELRQFEHGMGRIDGQTAGALALLYGADLGEILPHRLPLTIGWSETSAASVPLPVVSTCGVSLTADSNDHDDVLDAYLRLVRRLRGVSAAPVAELRRADIAALADHLDITPDEVIDRLGALMGATHGQRRAMLSMFVAGAMVIGLVGAAPSHAAAWSPLSSRTAVPAAAPAPGVDAETSQLRAQWSDAMRSAQIARDTATYGPRMGDVVRRTLAEAAARHQVASQTSPISASTGHGSSASGGSTAVDATPAGADDGLPPVGDGPGDGEEIVVAVGLPPVPSTPNSAGTPTP